MGVPSPGTVLLRLPEWWPRSLFRLPERKQHFLTLKLFRLTETMYLPIPCPQRQHWQCPLVGLRSRAG